MSNSEMNIELKGAIIDECWEEGVQVSPREYCERVLLETADGETYVIGYLTEEGIHIIKKLQEYVNERDV